MSNETTDVVEQRVVLSLGMKRTLNSLLRERGEIDATINEMIRMFVAQSGVEGTEFQLDLQSGAVIVTKPAEPAEVEL